MEKKWILSTGCAQREAITGIAPDLAGKTSKTIIKNTLNGSAFRLILGEAYSPEAVSYGQVMLEQHGQKKTLTFDGHDSVRIPPGGRVTSDPVHAEIRAGAELTLWLYNNGTTSSMSATNLAQEHSVPGNYCGLEMEREVYKSPHPGLGADEPLRGFCGLEVLADSGYTIAAFGDSITDAGFWVNPLRNRITAAAPDVALVNMGISGNRLLYDSNLPALPGTQFYGYSGLRRLDHDILVYSGIETVMLALGVNDISQPGKDSLMSPPLAECASFEELTAGYKEAIRQLHNAGIKVIGCTITPFKGHAHYNAATSAVWNSTNNWIRTSGAFDDIIDFAGIIADPEDPEQMDTRYDSGDHLHPSEAGGYAMARGVSTDIIL